MNIEFLKKCRLFQNLDCEDLEDLARSSDLKELKFNKGEFIFSVGDEADYLYILKSGIITVEKNDINGKRIIVNIFKKPGTIFGEVYLYLKDKSYDYSSVSITNSEIISIPRDFILNLGRQNKKYYMIIVDNMLEILSSKAFHLNQKLLILSSYTLRQKIANYLLQFCDHDKVSMNFNRKELAEYIGTTRPSLSRELINMSNEGLIKVNKGEIIILNREYLEDIV
ncbi:MAG: Crp/Fnr family transcriptional regulator [Tissierellia bacterium]|nr:Crp/Fnr family transcriptional regulator [Tissierellia bacterium]